VGVESSGVRKRECEAKGRQTASMRCDSRLNFERDLVDARMCRATM
jgi:hypothetical protein